MYQPYMPMLAKLFILSSVIHQVCFSLFSSLPYAVGQVRRSSAPQTSTLHDAALRFPISFAFSSNKSLTVRSKPL